MTPVLPILPILPILEVKNLNKSFGGLQAVLGVSFSIREKEMSAIIGPNGAGKTTLFNLISGFISPTSGSIAFHGREVVGNSVDEISNLGLGRCFQRTNIFPGLTVFENIQSAVLAKSNRCSNFFSSWLRYSEVNERTEKIIETVKLGPLAHRKSSVLSHGDQKLLDIAVTLALEPTMILLDEPTAGMSPDERFSTIEMVAKLWKEMNLTLLFIEHDMDIVFNHAQVIRVMNQGALIAEGTPAEIRNNREVVKAYLGE
jgi:branched-chain amino acid transport system ATP-binding protein